MNLLLCRLSELVKFRATSLENSCHVSEKLLFGGLRLAAEARNGEIKLECLPSGRLGGGPGREWRRW